MRSARPDRARSRSSVPAAVSIRPEHVGPTTRSELTWLLTSRTWTEPLPINVYVIEHERGLVLFDTGQDRASVTDPAIFSRVDPCAWPTRVWPDSTSRRRHAHRQLAAAGFGIAEVTTVVMSHLHQDHIGGLRELGHADIVVAADEWASLLGPGRRCAGFSLGTSGCPACAGRPLRLRCPAERRPGAVHPGHDLFGDGSLVLLPTPGHTPGSLSMLVRRAGFDPLLLVGDLTYDDDHFERGERSRSRRPGPG